MKTLTDVNRVFDLAFSREEGYGVSVITETDVVEAETRFIRPILGDALCDALRDGGYTELMDEFVAPALAIWTRYVVEPHLASRCCLCQQERVITEARNDHDIKVYRSLRNRASALSQRLTKHLNANQGLYPEYDPKRNFLNRSLYYGNII